MITHLLKAEKQSIKHYVTEHTKPSLLEGLPDSHEQGAHGGGDEWKERARAVILFRRERQGDSAGGDERERF